ncbi:hypothetical protein ITJ38_00265 [Agreia pratensis]|uniref:Uncharacterized protein n=1 Tax=Agreia pratensis TaxID=150121 RepID=A0A1X7IU86_9MICO|nr:hypothetical protein [Agreia pratensis]MBF4632833.1 hypothetical protein [Agreia pratensis]SMG18618.1 hypothetical protein SAMN06296010_0878 [Agreia pratensis]
MTDAAVLPPLVVGTDLEGVKKAFRVPLAFASGMAVFCAISAVLSGAVVGATTGVGYGLVAGFIFLIVALYQGYLALRVAGKVAKRVSAGPVLTLDATGLTANTTQGLLVLPWETVSSVDVRTRGRHDIATFRIYEGVTRDSAGVQTTITPKMFPRLSTQGFSIGGAAIDVPMQTILDATAAFTGGRLVAR